MKKKPNGRRSWAPEILGALAFVPDDPMTIAELRGGLAAGRKIAPYSPVAQAVRRLRLAGLVRRADGKRGPGSAATYALTAKGKRAAEKAARE